METREKIDVICEAAHDKKADDIVLMDMARRSSFCSHFVLASAPSTVRVKTIADSIETALEAEGLRVIHKEGYQDGLWVLLDYGDVVAHVFHEDTRKFYALETLWGDAPRTAFVAKEQ